MDNSVGTKTQSQNQDLADIAEGYRQKRKELIERNEESLQNLKEGFHRKEAAERASGDATVNHIRDETRAKVDQIRQQTDESLKNESQNAVAKIKTIESKNSGVEEGLKRKKDEQDAYYGELLQKARAEKTRTLAQEYNQTHAVQKNEETRRDEVEKASSAELAAISQKTSQEKSKALAENRDELSKLNAKQREELKKSQTTFETDLDKQKTVAHTTLAKQMEQQQKAFTAEREQETHELDTMKKLMGDQYQKQKVSGELKLNSQEKENRKNLETAIEKGTKEDEILRKNYDTQIKQIHQEGIKEVGVQKDHYTKQLGSQKEFYENEILTREEKHADELQKEDVVNRQKLVLQDEEHKKMLKNQREEFNTIFNKNDQVNKDSLANQHTRLVDAFVKQKSNLLERFDKYPTAKDDPFYKMKDFETRLHENSNFYFVETKVPEHEKHNIDVIVKDDRVIVTGQRLFKENVKNEDRQLSTNSSQSFREVIPLKHPTLPKAVEKTYANGMLKVSIPKLPIS